jgi:NitT/TauT family transport system substrate-binding protein
MRTLRYVSLLLVTVMALAAGCSSSKPASKPEPSKSGSSSTAPATAPAPQKEAMKVTIAVGGKDSIIYLPPAIAMYNGFYKEEGIDLTMEDLPGGGAQAAQELVSGKVDFASMAVEQAAKSKAQGVDLVVLDLYTRYPAITLVVNSKYKDKVKTVADLKGMKVGVTSPGSATHKALLSLMDKFGLKPTDVEAIGVGTNTMPKALDEDKVQAAFGLSPWVDQVVTSNKAYILWDLRTKKDTEALYGDSYPFVSLVTRREVIQKNPDLVERVVRATVRGNKFLASNSPETITSKIPAEAKGNDEALYLASLRANLEAFAPDGLASEKGLQIVIDSLKKDKVIPENADIKPSMIFDGSWAEKVK